MFYAWFSHRRIAGSSITCDTRYSMADNIDSQYGFIGDRVVSRCSNRPAFLSLKKLSTGTQGRSKDIANECLAAYPPCRVSFSVCSLTEQNNYRYLHTILENIGYAHKRRAILLQFTYTINPRMAFSNEEYIFDDGKHHLQRDSSHCMTTNKD